MNLFQYKYSLIRWRHGLWLFAVLLFLSPLLLSCINEDLDSSSDNSEDPEMTTLNFSVQKTGANFGIASTRASGYEEGDISNLYVITVMTSYFNYNLEGVDTNDGNIGTDPNGKKYYEQPMTSVRNRVTVTPLNVYEFNSDFDVYTSYKLTLYPGRYRFYVVANCDMYVSNFYNANGSYTEDQVNEVVLNFSPDAPLRVAHLPMACHPKDIKYGLSPDPNVVKSTIEDPSDVYNYTVPIYKESKDDEIKQDIIFADLTFQCSKVRYTILFDATQPTAENNYEGISVGFGDQSLRFYVDESSETNPRATKIRNSTDLFANVTKNLTNQNAFLRLTDENSEDLGLATWNLGLKRYVWPESGKDYPKYASDPLVPWDANLGLDEWKARRQRVWQGIIYLPANDDADNNIDHTVLEFPYIIDWYPEASDDGYYVDGQFDPNNFKTINLFGGNNNETHYKGGTSESDPYGDQKTPIEPSTDGYDHGLVRGKFYDVVALVRNPDEWDLETIVYGEIKDWHETDQNLEENGGIIKDGKEEKKEAATPETTINPWDYTSADKKW